MNVAIIHYNAGNIHSVRVALLRLGIEANVTDNPEVIHRAEKVIFPGVGEARSAMTYLKERKLDLLIQQLEQPVLGICLGLQLMCRDTEENNTEGLGIFDVTVRRFKNIRKVPHIGWNEISILKSSLFSNISESSHVYFVHSYYAELSTYTSAICEYGVEFSAAFHKDNFYAVQFHPEKSGTVGEQIIKNFIAL